MNICVRWQVTKRIANVQYTMEKGIMLSAKAAKGDVMKITLLGDSIRLIGYGTLVPELLGEEFEVFQPEDNCRFAKYTLRGLFDWKAQMEGSRIVHWNNGLWDVCDIFGDGTFSSREEYLENMLRIASILVERYDKVIFATTTPIDPQNAYNRNEDIIAFNELLVPRLKDMGIIINDLHSVVYPHIDEYIRKDDLIHLTDVGIKACAEQVARVIRETAESLA